MRKLLLVCIVFSFKASFAQLEKKTWLLGGDVSYDRYEYSSNGTTLGRGNNLEVTLNDGYFFWNRLALGARVSLQNAISKYPPYPNGPGTEQRLRQTTWGLGPFVRYYFLPAQNPVNLFVDASGMYNLSSNNSTNTVGKSWSGTGAGGAAIFLNQNIGLELMLAYQHSSGVGYDNKSNNLQFKAGFQIHLKKAGNPN